MDENQIGTIIVDCAAHKKQLLTYLKLTGLKLGYLLNFRESPDDRRNHENYQWTTLSKNLRVPVAL
jgi:hypothetical protein